MAINSLQAVTNGKTKMANFNEQKQYGKMKHKEEERRDE